MQICWAVEPNTLHGGSLQITPDELVLKPQLPAHWPSDRPKQPVMLVLGLSPVNLSPTASHAI